MKVIIGDNVQIVYKELIETLFNSEIVNNTKEINNCILEIKNPSITKYYLPYKRVSEKYINAELSWYWSGDNKCATIGKYAKMWLDITDDGKTNNSAYGFILFKKYGFNQLEQIIELLKNDRFSRRAVLNISDPTIDRISTKDMQCTIGIQFIIRDNALEETVYMRSNDVYFGFPNDYVFFVSLGLYIATNLNIKLAKYTHIATSMHMYLRDEEKLKASKANMPINIDIKQIINNCYLSDIQQH